MKLYRAEKALRIADGQVCQNCKTVCGVLQGHHYWTNRIRANVLRFVILGQRCHGNTNLRLRMAGLLAWPNGTFSASHPAVVRAEERYSELMETIKRP